MKEIDYCVKKIETNEDINKILELPYLTNVI